MPNTMIHAHVHQYLSRDAPDLMLTATGGSITDHHISSSLASVSHIIPTIFTQEHPLVHLRILQL